MLTACINANIVNEQSTQGFPANKVVSRVRQISRSCNKDSGNSLTNLPRFGHLRRNLAEVQPFQFRLLRPYLSSVTNFVRKFCSSENLIVLVSVEGC